MFEQPSLEDLLIELRRVPSDFVRAEPAGFEVFDRRVQGFGGLFGKKGSGEAFLYRFERPAFPIGDDRSSAGHRFDRNEAEIFFGRKEERLRLSKEPDFFFVARPEHPFDVGFRFFEKFAK